jgi:RNA polymerase sigma-70 factor (ECF subfamily)
MYNTSLRILNNSPEAEDVMQDSFLDAFRKIDSYSGEGSFGGWLKRIVVNNSLDALKKRKDLVSIEESKIEMEDIQVPYAENVDYKVEEIKSALKNLSEDNRVIVSLFLFEGYDHEEISQVLKISNNTSRTRFSRAKGKLLKILTEQRSIKMFHPN